MKPTHESAILKPRDPSITDSNSWPDFPLTHVEVFDANSDELTSLLLAGVDRPVTIHGKIERLPHDRMKYLLPRVSIPISISVTDVRTFGYGQYEEGDVALWAAGQAGWFELKPSRKYKDIFNEMLEAVGVLYFLADMHRDYRVREYPSVRVVLAQYAEDSKHACADVAAARAVLDKHRTFLLVSMEKKAEGINWKRAPIMKYIRSLEPEASPVLEDTTIVHTPSAAIDDEAVTHTHTAGKGKGKSSLRPSTAALSIKGAGRRQSAMDDVDITMTDVGIDSTLSPTPSAPNLARINKRKAAAARRAERAAKRKKLDDETHHEETTIVVSTPDPADSGTAEIPLPLAHSPKAPRTKQKKPVEHIRIIDEPLPSYLAEGPDGVWRCPFDGCSQTIYGVKEEGADEPKQLIKEHYRRHALESQEKLDLIYKEERPYLPVSNLVRRIREMAAAKNLASVNVAGAVV